MLMMRDIQPSYRAVYSVPMALIAPGQRAGRTQYDGESLLRLAASIRQHGLLQPITLRAAGDAFEIVLGERRYRACAMLGFGRIDAFILQAGVREAALFSLLENSQQEPLHDFELAEDIATLREEGMPLEDIARSLGNPPDELQSKLNLLNLTEETRSILREAGLSLRHARALLRLKDGEKQAAAARQAAQLHMTVRETEALVQKELQRLPDAPPARKVISMVWEPRLYMNALRGIVRQMEDAGVEVQTDSEENEEWLTLRVRARKR